MALVISFKGKTVLVTGGASGLGKAVVKKLHDDGATVFAVDKNETAIEELKKECPNVKAVALDLTDFPKTKEVIQSFGPVDYLVNNAGIINGQPFLDIDMETMKKVMDVNLNSCVVVSQVVARGMIDNKIEGSIVNVASMAGIKATPQASSYGCSKAAVIMLTKIMAIELGAHNIRVNSISPGMMDTPMISPPPGMNEDHWNKILEKFTDLNIIKRLIKPDEAADMVLFLLSPTSSMITGENIVIDAGKSIT